MPGDAQRAEEPSAIRLAERVTRSFLLRHRVCPIGVQADGSLRVAVEPESLLDGLDDLSVAYGTRAVPVAFSAADVQVRIERITAANDRAAELADRASDGDEFASDIRDLASQPPVVRYLNLLVRDAHEAGASDIHLESRRRELGVRFRIDGVLVAAPEPPTALGRAVVSRAKLLAELDIAERRHPQDGRFRVRMEERELDLRISTVPTIFGESIVLRLLEHGGRHIALTDLGLPDALREAIGRLARKPHGMVLACGPTGAGKSTTLYAALGLRESAREKIITLEDPIEYALDGVTQVPIHEQSGVTFATMLRSILRQDPDVIMVGEMRDSVTAELAVRAALTGHMVFSTLHTNDASSAITRLVDLGVPPYLVAATLDAVLAQRLVRRICGDCREQYTPDAEVLDALLGLEQRDPAPRDSPAGNRFATDDSRTTESSLSSVSTFTRGRGCPTCRWTGYRGRVGIFELLVLSRELRDAVVRGAHPSEFRELAARSGMRPLRSHGLALAAAGITTAEEVLRVTSE